MYHDIRDGRGAGPPSHHNQQQYSDISRGRGHPSSGYVTHHHYSLMYGNGYNNNIIINNTPQVVGSNGQPLNPSLHTLPVQHPQLISLHLPVHREPTEDSSNNNNNDNNNNSRQQPMPRRQQINNNNNNNNMSVLSHPPGLGVYAIPSSNRGGGIGGNNNNNNNNNNNRKRLYQKSRHTTNGNTPQYSPTSQPSDTNTPSSMSLDDQVLSVLDMGLDFRSYQDKLDALTGRQLLGNVLKFPANKVVDMFEPTVGLMVTVAHMYTTSPSDEIAKMWLEIYGHVQELFLQHSTEGGQFATASLAAIKMYKNNSHPDKKLMEILLLNLDNHSGAHNIGGQLPSQRRIPSHPKGTFCNLHLSDNKCNLEFSCNQIHLHQAGSSVRHRIEYHVRMAVRLEMEGCPPAEIEHRVKDSLFYAKYGNRVTVKYKSFNIQFFKTIYTPDRLEAALRSKRGGNNNNNTSLNICPQDPSNVQGGKPIELPLPENEIRSDINNSWQEIKDIVREQRALAHMPRAIREAVQANNNNNNNNNDEDEDSPQVDVALESSNLPNNNNNNNNTDTVNDTASDANKTEGASNNYNNNNNNTTDTTDPETKQSLSTSQWEQQIREYVENAGLHQHKANDTLLYSLAVDGSLSTSSITPSMARTSSSETFTSLMREANSAFPDNSNSPSMEQSLQW